MDSRTKNRQPIAALEAMIAHAYGSAEVPPRGDSIAEIERGWFNAVYAVRLRSGRRVVLKIGPAPTTPVLTYERRMLENELAALRLIAEASDVPVPAIEFADTSGAVIESPWFSMTRIEGENLGELIEEGALPEAGIETRMAELGAINRALNSLAGPGFGYLHTAPAATWREAFLGMVEDLLDDASRAGVALGTGADRIRAVLDAHAGALDAVTVPRLVEWDLWPANVIVSGGRIAGVVDHERALWGDPLMEAGFAGDDVPIYPHPDAFARGYGAVEWGPGAVSRRRLYSIHLLLVMIVEPAFRGPQDPGQAAWSRERLGIAIARLLP